MPFPPFFASEEEANRAYSACGRAAINWGPIELTMESMIIQLRHRLKRRHDQPMPVSFSKKWGELKSLLNVYPDIADAMRPAMTEAKRLHDRRKIIVHSLCQGTNLKGELLFGHSDYRRGVFYAEVKMTIAAVDQLADEMRMLRDRLDFVGELLKSRH